MRLCCRLVSAVVGTTLAIVVSASSATSSQQSAAAIRPVAAAHSGGAETFKRLYDFGLGKRASYVAEYKRLPMYNFGIGKRGDLSGPRPLGTLGAAPPGMYAFGIGKRGDSDADWDDDTDVSQSDLDETSLYDLSKRGRMYSMGIGKRGRLQYSFGIGKRVPVPSDTDSRLAEMLIGSDVDADELLEMSNGVDHHDATKRLAPQQYAFGIGKRRPGRYDFGIGKRTPRIDVE